MDHLATLLWFCASISIVLALVLLFQAWSKTFKILLSISMVGKNWTCWNPKELWRWFYLSDGSKAWRSSQIGGKEEARGLRSYSMRIFSIAKCTTIQTNKFDILEFQYSKGIQLLMQKIMMISWYVKEHNNSMLLAIVLHT